MMLDLRTSQGIIWGLLEYCCRLYLMLMIGYAAFDAMLSRH